MLFLTSCGIREAEVFGVENGEDVIAEQTNTPISVSDAAAVPAAEFVGASNMDTVSGDVGLGGDSYLNYDPETKAAHDKKYSEFNDEPTSAYVEGVVVIESENEITESDLEKLGLKSATPIYPGAKWYTVELFDAAKTIETVKYLRRLDCFERVDYDYYCGADANETIDIWQNGYLDYSIDRYYDFLNVQEAWGHMADNNVEPGGSPDVVVAVIDTGVDYNHVDLRNNIWKNTGEIPDNGIDDDGNGYVDDYYGWDFVGNDRNPMDENGHGTHVAGIIAAENNTEGIVGIAFNCKIMCIRAGNAGGVFASSVIAAAINYAYANGASVINMSFGGYGRMYNVESALMDAYPYCTLVAAAGNDARICPAEPPFVDALFPAALPYVIGVMSCNSGGSISAFSNTSPEKDAYYSYDVFAPGEMIASTWAGNGYQRVNGTSMAAPFVSAIAALIRSEHPDKEEYPNKYVSAQIVGTGSTKPDRIHYAVNAYDALSKIPKPNVSLTDHYIFDLTDYSPVNNSDSVINAGETIRAAIVLSNKGGRANNVQVTLSGMNTDPLYTITQNTISFADIGTYSQQDCGGVYDGTVLTDPQKYFEITVSPDAPNGYMIYLKIDYSYTNGFDPDDETVYRDSYEVSYRVTSGFVLPETITEDTVFDNSRKYVVTSWVVITEGVTVTFLPGCEIRFWGEKNGVGYAPEARIVCYGTLNFSGSADERIAIMPSYETDYWACMMDTRNNGQINMSYCDYHNPIFTGTSFLYSSATFSTRDGYQYVHMTSDPSSGVYNPKIECSERIDYSYFVGVCATTESCEHSCFVPDVTMHSCGLNVKRFNNNYVLTSYWPIYGSIYNLSEWYNNYFCTNNLDGRSDMNDQSYCLYLPRTDSFGGNYFAGLYKNLKYCFGDSYYYSDGTNVLDKNNEIPFDSSQIWPFVEDMKIYDKNGESVTTVGFDSYTVKLRFNVDMDTSEPFKLTYGSQLLAKNDYEIKGNFVNSKEWEGTLNIPKIESAIMYFEVRGGKDLLGRPLAVAMSDYQMRVDTTSAMAMDLIAEPTPTALNLTWVQDDYETLMGYNVYRSETKDGNYVRLNNTIIPADVNTFADENAEPGKSYWYTFTVVLSDFTESKPAVKIRATMFDSVAPNVYHTPVNQGYVGNNLVIFCTASDNVEVTSVKLFYRVGADGAWKSLDMAKANYRYSATVLGSDVTLEGIQYYIVASDGINTYSKGNKDDPYSVLVKEASALSGYGDVDGDGIVTTKDALMIIQAINGDLILTDDQFRRADLNKNEQLDSVEALRILQYINGKVVTLEM